MLQATSYKLQVVKVEVTSHKLEARSYDLQGRGQVTREIPRRILPAARDEVGDVESDDDERARLVTCDL